MANLMANADLAIGAGGISTYERLYLRLPSILKATSFNQLEPLAYMSSRALFELFTDIKELECKLEDALLRENSSPPDCVENGSAKLVSYMIDSSVSLKKMTSFDVMRTFKWLKNSQLRDDFLMSNIPQRSHHFKYWRNVFKSVDQRAYAIYHFDTHVGNCGLKNIDTKEGCCELWIYVADISVRRRGVAKKSIIKLIMNAQSEFSCNEIYLHVSKLNHAAVNLYKATGFNYVDKPLKYPWHNKKDIHQMVKVAIPLK